MGGRLSKDDGGRLSKNDNGLTILEQSFADIYLMLDGQVKGAQIAFKRVSPKVTDNVAKNRGSELLHKESVWAYIQQQKDERSKYLMQKFKVSKNTIVRSLAEAAFLDVRELFDDNGMPLPIHQLPAHVARSIQHVEVLAYSSGPDNVTQAHLRYKLVDKATARRELARYLNLFKKEAQTSGSIVGEILREIGSRPQQPPGLIEPGLIEYDNKNESEESPGGEIVTSLGEEIDVSIEGVSDTSKEENIEEKTKENTKENN